MRERSPAPESLTQVPGAVRNVFIPRPRYPDCPFPELLASESPLEVEIGCGKGKFITARAEKNPGINFLAMDKAGKWLKRRRLSAEKRGLSNLKFLVADAREIIRDHLPRERVSMFHIYFPDPWPKRRHRDRRLVTAEFLRQLYERLVRGGFVYAATDDADYFLAFKEAIEKSGCAWMLRETKNERMVCDVELPMTNYETKFHTEGRDLHYLEARKP